jgi:N-methylhydantoinase A
MIGVDVGGTFTDVVSIDGSEITTVKVATAYPDTEKSVLEGAAAAGVEAAGVFNHASTHGLNAIITRNLPKIAFLTTAGHRDILDQGRAYRPSEALTDPHWRRPFGDAARPVVPRYLRRGILERIQADGSVLLELDEEQARAELAIMRRCEVEGVAICLINAYVNPVHEQRLREIVGEELGDVPCSISSAASPLAKEFARASTTVVDVLMKLLYGDYTSRLSAGLGDAGFDGQLNYANCAAQLLAADVAMERPFEIVFAGPAAGTVASGHFGSLIGVENLICADVGGTSSDLSLVREGRPLVDTTFELEHDFLVNALANQVISIGAGGGSLVTVSHAGEIQVGPGSAGSEPGPACYGRGGEQPTTTDTCLLMGVIDGEGFAGGKMKLDPERSRAAFAELDSVLSFEERIAYAFRIAVNNIAEGINNVVIQQGVDARDYGLMAFGAAGPMLIPAALELINAAEVIVPPHPGLFSALGLVSTDQVYADSRCEYMMLSGDQAGKVDAIYAAMEDSLRRRLDRQDAEIDFVRSFDGRLAGQTWETPFVKVAGGVIDAEAITAMEEAFHQEYETRWGNRFEAIPVQGVTYRVEAVLRAEKVDYERLESADGDRPAPIGEIEISYLEPEPIPVPEYSRGDLRAGHVIEGPAVVREPLSTTFLIPGQRLRVGTFGELHITQKEERGV